MADRNPDAEVGKGTWEAPDDVPQWVEIPSGIPRAQIGKTYYAQYHTLADGRVQIEWYKRNTGDGTRDPVLATTIATNPGIKKEWDAGETKQQDKEGDTRGPQNGPKREVYRGGKWVMEDNPLYQQAIPEKGPPGGKPYIDEEGPNGRRLGWNPETQQYDRDLGSSPSAQAAAAKPTTASKRDPVQGYPGVFEVTTANSSTGQTETHFENAAGETVPDPRPAAQQKPTSTSARKPVQGKPGIYEVTTANAQTGVQETHYEDEDGNRVPTPTEQRPGSVVKGPDGKSYWATPNADPSKPPTLTPIDELSAKPAGAGLKNVEPYKPDPTDPNRDLGLTTWAQRQRAKIGLPADQGGITQEDYNAAVKEAHEVATSYASNTISAQNARRTQWLDTENQRERLSGEASTDYGRALPLLTSAIRYAKPGSPAIRDLIPGIMAEQARYRSERQATGTPPPALDPMFQWASSASAASANGQPPPPRPEARPAAEPAPATPPVAPQPFVNAAGQTESPAGGVYEPGPVTPGQQVGPWFTETGPEAPTPDAGGAPQAGLFDPLMAKALGNEEPMPPPPPGLEPSPEGGYRGPGPRYPVDIRPSPGMPGTIGPEGEDTTNTLIPSTPFAPSNAPLGPAPRLYPNADPNMMMRAPTGPGLFDPLVRQASAPWDVNPVRPDPAADSAALGTIYQSTRGLPPPPGPGEPGYQPPVPYANPESNLFNPLAQQAGRPAFDPFAAAGRAANLGIPHDALAQALLELGLV